MNDSDLTSLEANLNLKLPAKVAEVLRRAAAEFVGWPAGSEARAGFLLTDPGRLLQVNQQVRQAPADYVKEPAEMAKAWPDHLFVCGLGNKISLWVVDCREETGRMYEVNLSRKKFGAAAGFKDIEDLYKAVRSEHRRASKSAKQQAGKTAAWRKLAPDVRSPDLVALGRGLARPALVLDADGDPDTNANPYAAVWLGAGVVAGPRGEWRHRISIDCAASPVNPRKLTGVISVYESVGKDNYMCEHAVRHDPQATLPVATDGTKLYSSPLESLPPIQFLFKRGPAQVQEWLAAQSWTSADYSKQMPDPEPGRRYLDAWFANHPMFTERGYAMLGGWLMPFPEGDWEELAEQTLLLMTIKDAEPYIEVWDDGRELRCISRIT